MRTVWPLLGALMVGLVAGALLADQPRASAQGMRPPPPVAQTAPFDLKNGTIVEEGGRLFQQNCTGYCHGREGRISRAPKLRGRQFESLYLFNRISHGFPPMPAYKTIFPPEQIWKLVAYIMSLADKED